MYIWWSMLLFFSLPVQNLCARKMWIEVFLALYQDPLAEWQQQHQQQAELTNKSYSISFFSISIAEFYSHFFFARQKNIFRFPIKIVRCKIWHGMVKFMRFGREMSEYMLGESKSSINLRNGILSTFPMFLRQVYEVDTVWIYELPLIFNIEHNILSVIRHEPIRSEHSVWFHQRKYQNNLFDCKQTGSENEKSNEAIWVFQSELRFCFSPMQILTAFYYYCWQKMTWIEMWYLNICDILLGCSKWQFIWIAFWNSR